MPKIKDLLSQIYLQFVIGRRKEISIYFDLY